MSKLSRFAGLAGAIFAKKGEDDSEDMQASEKPTKRDDETQEEFDERLRKWEEENDGGDADGKKKGEGPKDTSDDDQDKTEKLDAAKAEGRKAGIAAEKARWTNVLASQEAAGKVEVACDMLADTDLDAAAITKALGKMPAPNARTTLAQRQPNPTPAPATGDGHGDPAKAEGPKGFAARMAAAVEKARPSAKKS